MTIDVKTNNQLMYIGGLYSSEYKEGGWVGGSIWTHEGRGHDLVMENGWVSIWNDDLVMRKCLVGMSFRH